MKSEKMQGGGATRFLLKMLIKVNIILNRQVAKAVKKSYFLEKKNLAFLASRRFNSFC